MPETEPVTRALTRAGVFTPSVVAAAAGLERRSPNPRAFALGLLRRGWATPLQARWAARGFADRLAVGRYVLLDRIGTGGMAQVFLARHRELARLAAVKLVRPDRQGCLRTRARFVREVRAVGRLNHAHVVHGYDAGTVHGVYYLAMEHVPGPDLSRVVVAGGPLDPGRACEYVRQAALGLGHVHTQGLVHRDVKPANLGLTSGGRVVKVLDVGLARVTAPAAGDAGLSLVGRLVGSADYAAPEQVADSRRVDARADQYALGCTLYHLLAGHVPFPGGTAVRKAMRHLSEAPEPIEAVRPGLPPGVCAVVRRLMARRPEDRFPTADDAAAALAPFAVPVVGTLWPPGSGSTTAFDMPTLA